MTPRPLRCSGAAEPDRGRQDRNAAVRGSERGESGRSRARLSKPAAHSSQSSGLGTPPRVVRDRQQQRLGRAAARLGRSDRGPLRRTDTPGCRLTFRRSRRGRDAAPPRKKKGAASNADHRPPASSERASVRGSLQPHPRARCPSDGRPRSHDPAPWNCKSDAARLRLKLKHLCRVRAETRHGARAACPLSRQAVSPPAVREAPSPVG